MEINLITGYPFWFNVLCVLLGVSYSLLLYFRERKHEFNKTLAWLMAIMRFASVSLLSFFLLSPLLATMTRSTEKPVIIIGQDNSASILEADSSYYISGYLERLNAVISDLKQDYDVRLYTIGEKTSPVAKAIMDTTVITFDEQLSDLSSFFDEVDIIYANRNMGALVLSSDGIFNKGINPLYAAEKLKYPLYTVALGDTSIQPDLILRRLNYNRIAFKGNDFPIEVQMNANKSASSNSTISIYHQGKLVGQKRLKIVGNRYAETVLFNLEAQNTGLQRYRVLIEPLDNEVNTRNNYLDAYIDVLESKQKVLVLANSPHPDVTAIKYALSRNFNYEVEEKLLAAFRGQVDAYNLVILHQLPSLHPLSSKLMNDINRSSVPLLYIIGLQTDLGTFNGLKTGLAINYRQRNRLNEAQPAFNNAFVLFRLSEETVRSVRTFPPLSPVFGDYSLIRNADVMFHQQLGSVTTDQPLVLVNKSIDRKIGIITGDGLWKWRISDYMNNGNDNAFTEILGKLIQYLAIKEDKRLFQVIASQTFMENEQVIIDASLYNESYELINDPEAELVITSSDGVQYEYVFNKYSDAYRLNAGNFPVGDYRYAASVDMGMQTYTDAGGFSVLPLEIELNSTIADHNLMYQLAIRNDGLMLGDQALDQLPGLIRSREDVKPVVYSQKRFTDLINLPWIFILLVILLSVEWFLRKWGGSY